MGLDNVRSLVSSPEVVWALKGFEEYLADDLLAADAGYVLIR